MKRFCLHLFVLATLSFTGCAVRGTYYSSSPPPPYRVEVRGLAPRGGMVWVDGYWGWQNRNYVWVPGRWANPPRNRSVWVAPRWELRGGRYRFNNGRWR
jgi:hypothetical protein